MKIFIIILALVSGFAVGCTIGMATAEPEIIEVEKIVYECPPAVSELDYAIKVSALPMQISGGNLQWHRKSPDTTYTLEVAAIEIYNFGETDIMVSQLWIWVDMDSKLFMVHAEMLAGEKRTIIVEPMMTGYDGGEHYVSVRLLDTNKNVLDESNRVIKSLQPTGNIKLMGTQ